MHNHCDKKAFSLPILLIAAISFSALVCSTTGGLRTYKHVSSKTGESVKLDYGSDNIDTEKAYEVYFRLEKPVDCIKLNIVSKYIPDRFSGKKEHILTFFVLDQLIDISMFGDPEKKFEISEIGRNFDSAWNRKRNLVVCTGPGYPLLKFDIKTVYRLRFTTFRKVNFEFRIDIHADSRIFFIEKPSF